MTVSQIVKDFGGAEAFAKVVEAPVATVKTWSHRNSLPAHKDVLVVKAATKCGLKISYEDLALMRADAKGAA